MVNKFGLNHLILDIWSHSHSLRNKITGLPEANSYNFKPNAVRSIEIGWEENRSCYFLSFLWSQSSSFFLLWNIPKISQLWLEGKYVLNMVVNWYWFLPQPGVIYILQNILKNYNFAPLRGLPVLHFEKRVPPSTEHAHNRFESCSETKYGPTKKFLPSWSIPFPSLTWSAPVRWVRRGFVQIKIISVTPWNGRNLLICDRPYRITTCDEQPPS